MRRRGDREGIDLLPINNNSIGDDAPLYFGSGNVWKIQYQTDDANANCLACIGPEGGATDVPVIVIGDVTTEKDLTFFNGVTEPTLAVLSDDAATYTAINAQGIILASGGIISSAGDIVFSPGGLASSGIIGRGSTDTDITYLMLKNADGEICYLYPNATQDALTVSNTKP